VIVSDNGNVITYSVIVTQYPIKNVKTITVHNGNVITYSVIVTQYPIKNVKTKREM